MKGWFTLHAVNAGTGCNNDDPAVELAVGTDGNCGPCGTPNNGGCCLNSNNEPPNVGCTSANFQCVVTDADINPNGFCLNCNGGNAPLGCPGELDARTCTCAQLLHGLCGLCAVARTVSVGCALHVHSSSMACVACVL